MDTIRIAILNTYDKVCTYLDNEVTEAMHYYDDELHQYLKGSANTYTFKTSARHEDAIYLTEGNKLAFQYGKNDYYLNIMKVVRDEYEVKVTAYSLNFELLNEQKEAYKSSGAMTFAQYLDVFDYEKVVVLGRNEVSGKSISHEWTGTETMLGRIFSLANVFGAEVEFIPELNEDYSLKRIVMNVYREHTDTVQGVGTDRTDMILRYGKNVSGITKTSDITDLYTAIRPIGKDGLTVSSLNKTEYDSNGKVEYSCPAGKRNIYAVQARDRFPSNLMASENERYIAQIWEYDTDNVNVLYGQALAELKQNCVPQVSYEVDGYFDTGIGDTITIADDEYTPELYLQARVTEQSRSFTDPTQNKTTFSNFKELQSEIDLALIQKMNNLINANKVYSCSILTDNGIVFRNGEGATTLTASVMDVGKDMTSTLTIQWTVDGEKLATGKSITVNAADIPGKAVYRYEATDKAGISRGFCEVTVANVNDGEPGRPGEDGGPGADAYTLYLSTTSHVFNADYEGNLAKNISVSTVVVGYKGTKQLTPVIGTLPEVNGFAFTLSGTTITITGKKGRDMSDNGVINIPVMLDGIACTLTFTYAKVKDGYHGEDAKLCTVTGNQIMKYESGSTTPVPAALEITAQYQNTNHGKWQYLNEYDIWADFIPLQTNETITINEVSVAWVGDMAVIRAVDAEQVAMDTITLAKLRDGIDGKDGKDGAQGPRGLQGLQGDKGDQGIQGAKGADGKSSYTHIAYANSADGTTDFSVSDSNRTYIGMYVDSTAADSTNPAVYAWSKIKGADGSQGTPGKAGADGKTPYLHIAYANSEDGKTGFSVSDSVNKLYIGQYTDYSAADSTDPTKYAWTKIKGDAGPQGPQGSQGVQGPKGADGKTYYTWLKYADSPTTGMSDSPTGKAYIGLAYNKTTATESNTYSDYTWSLIKGEKGDQGVTGGKGADGKTYYTWIKYATSAAGANMSDDPSGKTYIGLAYNKPTSTESTTASDYTWSLIKGDKGDKGDQGAQGIQGPKGADGKTYYTWLKYADTPTTGMSDSPDGKAYIGLAYNKVSATESNVYSDYTWSKVKGEKGDQGVAGGKGADGKTYYTWVKYATNASGAGMSDDPAGKTYIGLAYNKSTATESTTASDYTWSLIKGDKGDTGTPGTGYTVLLSNEAYAFAAGITAALAGSTYTNVTAYKNTTQVAATVTKIGTAVVSGNASGVATGFTGLTAAVTGNGTTSCKIAFSATTSLKTKNGSVAVTITVDGKSFVKDFSFSLSLKGDTGGKGEQGDPTGIIESATAPTTKYEGMLWKHTGTVSGLVNGATYRWSGTAWEMFKFRADNIEAESFKGFQFDGAIFNNDFEDNMGKLTSDNLYHKRVGSASIKNGTVSLGYTEYTSPDNVTWTRDSVHSDSLSSRGMIFRTFNINGTMTGETILNDNDLQFYGFGSVLDKIYQLNQNLHPVATSLTPGANITIASDDQYSVKTGNMLYINIWFRNNVALRAGDCIAYLPHNVLMRQDGHAVLASGEILRVYIVNNTILANGGASAGNMYMFQLAIALDS